MTTATDDAATKALHAQADATKRDLSTAAGVKVPDGSEANPGQRIDPFEALKAMFAKSDAIHDAEAAESIDGRLDEVELARVRAMEAEAGVRKQPTQPADRTLHLPVKKDVTPTSQSQNERVTLDYNGSQISVSQADLDRAGGVELYIQRRQLDEQALAIARQQLELQQQMADMQRLREELQRGTSHVGQGNDPAISGAGPASQHRNDAGATGVDENALAEELAGQIYSGDREDAAKAILRLIRLNRARGDTPDVSAIVKQVQAEMGASARTEAALPPVKMNPALEAVNRQINDMANREFGDLMKNTEARAAAFERFKNLVSQPENKDRRAVDVAREACEQVEQLYDPARAKVVERKRGLQPVSTASGTAPVAGEVQVPDNSEFVAMMQAQRAFGRRTQ
jgi:hypothetical protein